MSQTTERAMVVVAHPDDPEFIAGGTVAKWISKGTQVVYVICTNGDKGSSDHKMTSERLAAIRKDEQLAAARLLGVRETVFLGYEDGMLQPTLKLRMDITRAIRKYRPQKVICQDPETRYYEQRFLNHPDHRAAGEATLDAIYPSARDRLTFPQLLAEGLEPFNVEDIYVGSSAHADHWEDIDDTIDLKIAALKQHRSQLDGSQVETFIREWAKATADGHGMAYAEAFKYIDLREIGRRSNRDESDARQ